MLDKEVDEEGWVEGGLPPKFMKGFEDVWMDGCGGEDTELARAAFYQFTSRDEDTLMVPFYDMCNHSNDPKKLNTINSKPRRPGKPFVLRATRDINPGEQIFISYTRCNRCWHDIKYKDCTTWSYYSTSDVFDIFGFVEDFPQTWSFPVDTEDYGDEEWDEVLFCLDHDEETGTLLVTFGDNYSEDSEDWVPTSGGLRFLQDQLLRLKDVEVKMKNDEKLMASMPNYEWEMSWRYHEALMTAISAAILAADIEKPENIVEISGMEEIRSEDESSDDEEDSSDDSSDDEDKSHRGRSGSDEL
eukprot:scaffold3091_cov186-Alexandrium_tamarense.AAC.12